MKKLLGMLSVMGLFCGCSTMCARNDRDFRENIQELIDCQYRVMDKDGLTVDQKYSLQFGCYALYQMRKRP